MERRMSKFFSILLVLCMIISMMPAAAFAASTPSVLYLKPNSNWLTDSARFAAYFFSDSGNTWVSMTDSDGDGYYEAAVPSGYSSVIFCRMNPSSSTNSWDYKWNQTGDLTVPTNGNNCYTMNSDSWDTGTWGTYSTTVEVDYYLIGYINGANLGCEEDSSNLGSYKFVDGKLTATFTSDSYVFIKTSDNANWYMTKTYVSDSTATFYNTNTGSAAEKMFVPGGASVTFTLTVNSNDTLTLSYTVDTSTCKHLSHSANGICYACNKLVGHTWSSGACTVCGTECDHSWSSGKCEICGTSCSHSYDSGKVTTAAGCITTGVKTYTCATCGSTKTETVPATGHSYKDTVVAPTCTTAGYTTHTCSACGDSYQDSTTAATGHNYSNGTCTNCGDGCTHSYDSGTVTKAATCTTTGVKTYTCSKCGGTKTESIAATGHSYKSTVTAPTCTANGYTTNTCSSCGDSYTSNSTAATGHSWNSGTVTTAATCTQKGTKTYTCSTCKTTKTEEIAATGHSYKSTVTAPTCTAAGYTTYTCSSCGDSYTGNTTAATGHNYSNGTCTVCGDGCTHNWSGSTCTVCGTTRDYYLIGYINGANYGCEEDSSNLGTYKFSNGKLTATFDCDSYVFVKTGDNATWYMSEGYCDQTSVTLYNTSSGIAVPDKLYVPGGVQVTFTLTVNASSDTLTLSYSVNSSSCSHLVHGTDGVCTACGAAVDHSYDSGTVTSAATCTTDGVRTYTCSICEGTKTETITAAGHSYSGASCIKCGETRDYYLFGYINGANYACEEDADNLGIYKFVNGTLTVTFESNSYVAVKTGDNLNWYMTNGYPGDGVSSATLYNTNTGIEVNKLYVPGGAEVTFTLVVNTDDTLVLSYEIVSCSHSYDSGTVTTEATCLNTGVKTYTCSICGSTKTETIAALGHSYTTTVVDPTCTANGYTLHECGTCGYSYRDNVVNTTGHSHTTVVTAPTCTTAGYTTYTCTKCGEVYTSDATAATGHSYSNGTCTVCGAVDSDYTVDYYLFGYINGADYGCGSDLSNLGSYKFVNGQVTVVFTEDSYVAVKTGDNASFYMTNGYVGAATSATLYKFTDPDATSANKLLVYGGQTATFTLTENWDGNLILSYTVDASSCQHTSHSTDGVCTLCGTTVEHTYTQGVCSVCSAQDPDYVAYDYYLFGYINGANYGCEEDAANLGYFQFRSIGTCTVTFLQDSYVGVKAVNPGTGEVVIWYMTDGYQGEVTSVTMYDSTTLGETADKLFAPGNVRLIFTIVRNDDGSITLSYEEVVCEHTFDDGVVTTEATCTTEGSMTYTCSSCGHYYLETIAATGHSYVDGTCSVCGDVTTGNVWTKVDPSAITSSDTIAITMTKDGVTWALYNANGTGSAPTAVVVTVNGTTMTSDVVDTISWNVVSDTNGLIIYVAGSTATWLYSTSSNNGVRVGTNTNKYWVVDATTGYLQHVGTSRYMGVYTTNPDWRAYTSTTTNIAGQTLSFWKLGTSSGGTCTHSYTASVTTEPTCTTAGVKTYTCSSCGDSYTESIAATGHSYTNGTCGVCGAADPAYTVDYYLIGYINGANYGCEEDSSNLGSYKFTNGKLTVTFDVDSYVFVKTGDNAKWYMSEGYSEATSVTLYNTTSGIADPDKLFVPGGVEITFTLTVNSNDTLTLSYVTAECAHSYSSSVTTQPGCTTAGVRTYTCSKCGDSFTESIAATGHSYVSGTCTGCGAADPSYTVDYYLIGYINGANYGCEEDSSNLGSYKFASGKLTVTFNSDSYVFVKTGDNAKWYMSEGYSEATSVTLYNTTSGLADPNKLYVPGGVEITFTLTVNSDDTLTLSYVTATCAHSYNSSVTTAATCTTTGVRTYTCSKCGSSYTESIAATGHSYSTVVTAPTCTAAGYTTYSCSNCSYSYTGNTVAATGHNYVNGVCSGCGDGCSHSYTSATTDPTCTTAGSTTYTCSKCGNGYTETIAATGHSWSNGKCSVCGDGCSHSYSSGVCTICGVTAEGITIHLVNTLGWSGVVAHAWEGSTSTALSGFEWPGQIIQRDANGYYTFTVDYTPASGNSLGLLFHNFNGSQTADVTINYATLKSASELWIQPSPTANSEGKYDCTVATAESVLTISPEVNGTSVTFRYANSSASAVYLAGSMNNWSTSANKMTKGSNGVWTLTLTLDPGVYEYKFVVDGEWIMDPIGGTTGGYDGNSIVVVPTDDTTTNSGTITVILHFYRESGEYDGWDVWFWGNEKSGASAFQTLDDDKGMIATFTVDGKTNSNVGYTVRKSDWSDKEFYDRFIDLSDVTSGTVHYYLNSGVATGSRVLGEDVIFAAKPSYANYSYDAGTVWFKTTLPLSSAVAGNFTVLDASGNATDVTVTGVTLDGNGYTLTLSRSLTLAELNNYQLKYGNYYTTISLNTHDLFYSSAFASDYTYYGDDLGATWSKASTTFKVWAPTAMAVSVKLYTSGNYGTDDLIKTATMTRGEKGVWYVTVAGDLNGVYYNYDVTFATYTVEATDPYARATGANGDRGMVIDLNSTDPDGWDNDISPNQGMSYTDAIIYEMHVREMTIHSSSGVKDEWRGKYLGLTQSGTNYNGYSTVLEHIKELGVTHVQLMPVYDYNSVDEYHLTDWAQYAWGYDPKNYNVPEGSYSTDPFNGEVRIGEFKEMVQTFHENGINVVMDVVYNHTFDGGNYCGNKIVPNYYSRFYGEGNWSNGSGCGNDFATERSMVRNYIVDSIMYWVEEYHIDGFRFDLVGLIDTVTINEIVNTVHAKYPYVMFYGEGWAPGGTAVEYGYNLATQGNAWEVGGFGFFNDSIRNAIAGDNGNSWGFASSSSDFADAIGNYFRASNGWSTSPTQTINYVSCHDNYCLMDKLCISRNGAYWSELAAMNRLSTAMVMMAQGTPFFLAGDELLREKKDSYGNRYDNGYGSTDEVSQITWSDLQNKEYAQLTDDYYAGLVAFRKNHAALRCPSGSDAWNYTSYYKINDNCIMFYVSGYPNYECSDGIVMIFNGSSSTQWVNLGNYGIPSGYWQACIHGSQAGINPLWGVDVGSGYGEVGVEGYSATVLVLGDLVHEESIYNQNLSKVNCSHSSHTTSGLCTSCGATVEHTYSSGSCSVCGLSQSASETMTVYYDNSTTAWSNVYVYAWAEAGGRTTEYTNAWPGSAMTAMGNGIYAFELPTAATAVIFNDGAGNQSSNLTVPSYSSTATLYDPDTASWTTYEASCSHSSHNTSGICTNCGLTVAHTYSNGACTVCKAACDHTWRSGTCYTCGYVCVHSSHGTDGGCTVCGIAMEHTYSNGTCTVCGKACTHSWSNGTCTVCALACSHSSHTTSGLCTACGSSVTHTYSGGSCSVCGLSQSAPDTITIYYDNTESAWTTVYAYAWTEAGGTTVQYTGSWPGTEMTLIGDNVYSITLSRNATIVIFSDGDSSQTGNLSVPAYDSGSDMYSSAIGSWVTYGAECEHSYSGVVTAPTCTTNGYTTYTCTLCGDRYTGSATSATGHTYANGICTGCGAVQSHTHSYKAVVTAPTCIVGGYTTYTCSCGDNYNGDATAATGHSYVNGVCSTCGAAEAHTHNYSAVITKPTCTTGGYTTYTCACGDSYTGNTTAAAGHSYTSTVTAPTCTAAGSTTYTCSVCLDRYTQTSAATGHNYVNGKCSNCGATQSTVESTLAEYVQDGTTLQCWNWSMANIEANMGLIANMGYTSIQLSPIQEIKESTTNKPYDNWWVLYQPISFKLNEAEGHCVGTRDEFISLCETAHKYGIKVIVDVVSNHLANNGGNILSPMIDPDILYDSECWHDYTTNSWDYSDRYNITQYCMGGLPDLNTGSDKIQQYVLNYLKDLIDCGADGFRFDAAKQIETPSDNSSFASDFWPTVVNGAYDYASSTRGIYLYCYGEMLQNPDDGGQLHISAYTEFMSVTESVWSNDVRSFLYNGNAGSIQFSYFKDCNADKLVLWSESHDTFADGSSNYVSQDVLNRAWAIVASRAYTMALYFPRANSLSGQELGEIAKTGWSSVEVKAVNRFHNAFIGTSEYCSTYGGYAYVERGGAGVVIVSSSTSSGWVSVPNHTLAVGTYVDQITGNTFTVSSDGWIYGDMGSTGIAVIYNATDVDCSHPSHGSDGYCYDCYEYVGHSSGSTCSVCGTATTRTIYFKNTDGWSNVYMYAWHDQGDTVTAAWPGDAMTLVDSETGLYAITVPVSATNVIFNDGNGTQTANIVPSAEGNVYDYSTGFWYVKGESNAADAYYLFGSINGADYNGFNYKFTDGTMTVTFSSDSYVFVCDSNGVEYMTEGWLGVVTSATMYNVTGLTEPNKLYIPGGVEVTITLTANDDGTVTVSYETAACEHRYTGVVTAPTCTAEGYTTYTCADCGDSYVGNTVAATGHSYVGVVSTKATCTTQGQQTFTCSSCGDSYTEGIAATGHSYNGVVTAPTCTTDGYTTYTCTACSDSYVGSTVFATGHNYVEGTCVSCGVVDTSNCTHNYQSAVSDATCTTNATTTYTCTLCGHSYTTTADSSSSWTETTPDGVDETEVESKTQYSYSELETTTSTESSLEGYTQTGSEQVESGSGTIDYVTEWPSGFDTSSDLYNQYNNTPVTDSGVSTYSTALRTAALTSNTSGSSTVVNSDKLVGYLYYHWHSDSTSYYSTAEKTGTYTHFCAYYDTTDPSDYSCDYSDMSYKAGYDHCDQSPWFFVVEVYEQTYTTYNTLYSYERWTEASEWSDDEIAESDTCKVFMRQVYRYVNEALADHIYNAVVTAPTCKTSGYTTHTCADCGDSYTDSVVPATGHTYSATVADPTCTAGGYTLYTCSDCGYGYAGSNVAATGHNYVPTVTAPTCTENGYTTYTCSDCGNSYVGNTVVTSGHSYSSVVTAPTCTKDGYTTYTCSTCGDSYTGNTVAATGVHTYVDGTCTGCGAVEVVPSVKMSSVSLALKDEVKFTGYFTIENIDASTATMGLMTFENAPTDVSVNTADHVIPGATYQSSKDRYIGYSQGIPAKEMGDLFYICAYVQLENGTYVYSDVVEYSVEKYAYAMLDYTNDADLQKLLIAMLNYGAEAQLYFGYNTDDLVNADLTDEQKNSLNSYSSDLMDAIVTADSSKTGNFVYTEAAFSTKTVNVTAGGALALNCRFNPAYTMDGDMTLYYWDAATYNNVSELTTANATGSATMTVVNGAYQASVTGIAAKDIDKTIYAVGVYESDGITYTTGVISYNLNTYFDILPSLRPACQGVCEAAVVYCDYAKLYFLGE